jgi:hypothetical protein
MNPVQACFFRSHSNIILQSIPNSEKRSVDPSKTETKIFFSSRTVGRPCLSISSGVYISVNFVGYTEKQLNATVQEHAQGKTRTVYAVQAGLAVIIQAI